MSGQAEPISLLWWLVSRASGIVALVLISLSVIMGLAMSTRTLSRPGAKRTIAKLHEHVALTALLAIGAHGLSLLGDHWLKPGLTAIIVPFALSYRPQFTGIGIIGGYLVLLLGPSFYLRRRIGARRWRRLHTLILITWILCAVHTLGAGSDAQRLWLRALVFLPSVPIAYLLVLRVLRGGARQARQATPHRASAESGSVLSATPHIHRPPTGSAPANNEVATMPASATSARRSSASPRSAAPVRREHYVIGASRNGG